MGLFRISGSIFKKNHTSQDTHKIYYHPFIAFIQAVVSFFSRKQQVSKPKVIAILLGGIFFAILTGIFFLKIPFHFFSSSPGADPIAYWKFDEGQGATAFDSAGSNNGTLAAGNSAPTWVSEDQCVSGKCLYFDGSNNSVMISNTAVFNVSTAFTFSAWIKPINCGNTLFRKIGVIYINICEDTNNLGIAIDGSETFASSVEESISMSEWQYISIVHNGSNTFNFYVNGSNVDEDTSATAVNNTGSLIIGNNEEGSSSGFKGFIDEVKIYNYARSAAQIQADYAARGSTKGVSAQFGDDDMSRKLSDGLVGYWDMDAGTGTSVVDLSGNNNTGTLGTGNSAPTWSSGKFGNGLNFDGSGDYVRNTDTVISAYPISISAWMRTTQQNKTGVFIGNSNSTFSFFELSTCQSDSTFSLEARSSGSSNRFCGTSSIGGEWHHVVGVLNSASDRRLYVDGRLEATNTTTVINFPSGLNRFTVGRRDSAVPGFDWYGSIDEVRVYNRALDPSEVKALYEWAPSPVLEWDFNEGVGATAFDSSINGNNGNIIGAKYVNGKYGSSLRFSTTNTERAAIVSPVNIPANNKPQSMTYWYKLDANVSGPDVAVNILGSGNSAVQCGIRSSTIMCWKYGGTELVNAPLPVAKVWYHVGYTYDGTTHALYVNGILSEKSTVSMQTGTTTDVQVGYNGDSVAEDWENGEIDEVRIYNYARTPSQIIEDMNGGHPIGGSPVGSELSYWKMDEGYGDFAYDSGILGERVWLAGGETCPGDSECPTWTNDGKFGKALSFDGGDFMESGTHPAYDNGGSSPYTATLWFRSNTNPTNNYGLMGIKTVNTNTQDRFLQVNSSGLPRFYVYDGTERYATGSTVVTDNNWHHLGGVYDGDKIHLYVDGNLEATTDVNFSQNHTNAHVVFSDQINSYYERVVGIIDEAKIYAIALTEEQIRIDYNRGETQVMGALSTGVGGTSPSNSASRAYCVPGDTSTCSPPVGEWKFDKVDGTTTYDTSTNGDNGTLTNGPKQVKGKVGRAISFDGVNDYVQISDSNASDLTVGTISLWVKPSSLQSGLVPGLYGIQESIIASSWNTGAGSFLMRFRENSGWKTEFVYPNAGSATSFYSTTTIEPNKWYHITASYDGSTYKMYINGKLENSASMSGNDLDTDRGPRIGHAYSGNYLYGLVDQVRVYNYARTPAQIAWEYNKGAPVAWYKMDECTGTLIKDWSENANGASNGNHGTLTIGGSGTQTSAGTCTTSGAWANGAAGKKGASISLDGNDDYIAISDPGTNSMFDFDTGETVSLSLWVKPDTIPAGFNYVTAISKGLTDGSGADLNYSISFGNEDNISFCYADVSDNYQCYNTQDSVVVGSWQQVVIIHTFGNPNSTKVYVNSKLQAGIWDTGDGTPAPNVTNEDLWIGAINVSGGNGTEEEFDGQIDDVKIYNYALTTAQIKTEMAGGAVRFE